MRYTAEEVLQYAAEEDVKFIRLTFCDVTGRQKNLSVMPGELERAFRDGCAFDGSAVPGFGEEAGPELLLKPDPSTLTGLPWRSENGRVVRMFCDILRPDGTPFSRDTRALLKGAAVRAERAGIRFAIGSELEFYLFHTGDTGTTTPPVPLDQAGYMDVAPLDRGEDVRREICLTLEQMGIHPESSRHGEGPGQNGIDLRFAESLAAADNAVTFRWVAETAAARNGLRADFGPKPLADQPGSGFRVKLSLDSPDRRDLLPRAIGGILAHAGEMTAFWNPVRESYLRLGDGKAPRVTGWSRENRFRLIRLPAAGGAHRLELLSPDGAANPYLSFALLIHAVLDGLEAGLTAPERADADLSAGMPETAGFPALPGTLEEARRLAEESEFLKRHLPPSLLEALLARYGGRG